MEQRQLEGRPRVGGGAEVFGFFQRGFFSGIRLARLRTACWALPRPFSQSLSQGARVSCKPRVPPGLRLSALWESRPFPLAEKGKSACGAGPACNSRLGAGGTGASRRCSAALRQLRKARPAEPAAAWGLGSGHQPPRPPCGCSEAPGSKDEQAAGSYPSVLRREAWNFFFLIFYFKLIDHDPPESSSTFCPHLCGLHSSPQL